MKLENFSFLPSFVGVPVICLLFGVLCCLIKRSILLNRLCVLILLQNAGSKVKKKKISFVVVDVVV